MATLGPADEVAAPAEPAQEHALPWLLAGVGALAGLAIYLLLDGDGWDTPARVGCAAGAFFAAVALGFTAEARREVAPVLFALVVGVVLGGLAFHLERYGERVAGGEYGFAAGVLACALALPLFQAGFLQERFATPYSRVHFHVWTNAVAGAAAGAFALIAFALLWLVDGLLGLVGIELIGDLLEDGSLAAICLGGAFGAALGVLRDNLRVIGTLQSVALLVLALLAVPLAAALLVFLAALVLSGGAALWAATDSATPVLLVCAAGSWVLANAVIRDDDEGASRSRVMRAAALVLALGILPLALFAAVSMGVRIDQHGLAPERLWALLAIGVATAFGLAYWAALGCGRPAGWAAQLRGANLRLAAGVCVLALLLALPLFDFGAISARNQLARLERGAVSAERFDYEALRWDFGEGGRRALTRLADSPGPAAELATEALARTERAYGTSIPEERDAWLRGLRVTGATPELAAQLRTYLRANIWRCGSMGCTALVVGPVAGGTHVVLVSGAQVDHFVLAPDGSVRDLAMSRGALVPLDQAPDFTNPSPDGTIEVRPFTGRQVYIEGEAVGDPFR